MEDPQVGWIAAIIIGGVAGWLAEQFMKSDMGILMNIVLGIVGAAIASAILSFFGVHLGGWIGYLVAGFIGAVLLIWIVRAVRGTRQSKTSRSLKAISTQHSAILAVEGLSNWRIEGVNTFRFARPPRLAASFISNQACDVRYWH